MITHVWSRVYLPAFEYASPGTPAVQLRLTAQLTRFLGPGYFLYTFSWIFDLFVIVGVVTTGLSAKAGYTWAAGNRPYTEISG